jgi:hypothetical protein
LHLVNSQNAFDRLFHANDSILREINNVGIQQLPNLMQPLASCLIFMNYTDAELENYLSKLRIMGDILVKKGYNNVIPLFNHYALLITNLKNQSTPQWG